jgi:ABC-2 type transport system ATP-binding protein
LDAGGVDDVLALIQHLNREHGTSFLLSSHQLAYLESICTHLAILHRGRIVLNGSVDALFHNRQARLTIRCGQLDKAYTLLAGTDGIIGITRSGSGDNGSLSMTLSNIDAAAINSTLVLAGVPVSALEMQQPNLTQLFHDVLEAH